MPKKITDATARCSVRALSPVRIGFSVLGVVSGLAICLFLWRPDWLFHWRDFRTGNEIVSRVEAFQKVHGHLPETLKEIGVDNPDLGVFYIRISDHEYCVWFGTTLGESEVFDSRIKKWDVSNGGCQR